MYNKLFSRILYSSIWTESYPTRLVWIAMLAAMDEDGIVHAATPRNLASLAGVTPDEAEAAVAILSAPDAASSNPDHDGRRIERFPGGWVILNAPIYRSLARRDDMRHKTAERVMRYTKRLSTNAALTPSEAYTDTQIKNTRSTRGVDPVADDAFDRRFWLLYPRKVAKAAALKAWRSVKPDAALVETILAALTAQMRSEAWTRDDGRFIPHAATWLRGRRWEDALTPTPTLAVVSEPSDLRERTVALLESRLQLLEAPRSHEQ